jgi:hypothetical protein
MKRFRIVAAMMMLTVSSAATAVAEPAVKFGLHFGHYTDPSTPVDATQVFALLRRLGAKSVRHNTYWDAYQSEQPIAFDPAAASASPRNYSMYLKARGYGDEAANFASVIDDLKAAKRNDLALTFNLNVIPDWVKRSPNLDPANPKSFVQIDNAALGCFLRDFINYASKRKADSAGLNAISGYQIFNEVGGWVRKYTVGYGFDREHQVPYTEYFEILDHAIAQKNVAYADIRKRTPKAAPLNIPPVVGPNLAGTYNPRFFHELFKYKPLNPESTNTAGKLKLEAISMHPYGVTVRPFVDVVMEDAMDMAYNTNKAWQDVADNLTYNRNLMPTDDWMTMGAMITRDPANSKAWGLYRYADKGYTADKYFDRNSEMGVERMMTVLAQNGYTELKVFLSEFGASSYRGKADGSEDALHVTTFADPYKYGFVPMNAQLSTAVAQNLQAETLVQSLGLIENWDFVTTATAYELFEGEDDGEQQLYGIARNTLENGKLVLKPSGLAYQAYLQGKELHLLQVSGVGQGVDLHIAADDDSNGFQDNKRNPAVHEAALLRGGDDVFDGDAGDDIVFGGTGNDSLRGGDGYDRLYGGFGADTIDGGAGADRIKGDAGDDMLTGGAGHDDFVFSAYAKQGSGNAGQDVITDFDPAEDNLTFIGAFPQNELLTTEYAKDGKDGVQLFYAANGASILLRGVKREQLKAQHFRLLNAERR